MLRNVALLVFGRLLLAVDSRAGQVLPPQNMSLLWMNDFEPEVTWAPPQHSVANCTYQVFKKTTKRDNDYDLPSPPWKSVVVMEGGFLQVSVKTVCGGKRSEPTVLNVTYPEMVKNVQCYILSSKHAHCSWESANPTAVVHFFYRLVEENLSTSVHDDSPSPRLRECPMSNYKERAGTGCVLQVTLKQGILIVFNGTVNKVPFRNTFRRMPLDHVSTEYEPNLNLDCQVMLIQRWDKATKTNINVERPFIVDACNKHKGRCRFFWIKICSQIQVPHDIAALVHFHLLAHYHPRLGLHLAPLQVGLQSSQHS
ncbi:uncharacterized protein LOC118301634 isoform X4 [Scophthalmus maximus]|uniref:uncharacterized protein LOC118301634 isoform X4 n=1 Tax=Scophthalmus maximus TaxID=52904 RepID=UPI0015E07FB0|nr:uncharacterized protein LOC118301634 isoform X4 [Scophthalmus maximus]